MTGGNAEILSKLKTADIDRSAVTNTDEVRCVLGMTVTRNHEMGALTVEPERLRAEHI